jgi:formamidopyrimidine-DNA glycosylase
MRRLSRASSRGASHARLTCVMPELPEVETTRRGIAPHVQGRIVVRAVLRRPDLRWPIPPRSAAASSARASSAPNAAPSTCCCTANRARRSCTSACPDRCGCSMPAYPGATAHDHVDLMLDERPHIAFQRPAPLRLSALAAREHARTNCCAHLGPEPLGDAFDGDYLFASSTRPQRARCKAFLMDQRIVVGVGNIYVAEALFAAGVRPMRAAGKVTRRDYADIGRRPSAASSPMPSNAAAPRCAIS